MKRGAFIWLYRYWGKDEKTDYKIEEIFCCI